MNFHYNNCNTIVKSMRQYYDITIKTRYYCDINAKHAYYKHNSKQCIFKSFIELMPTGIYRLYLYVGNKSKSAFY